MYDALVIIAWILSVCGACWIIYVALATQRHLGCRLLLPPRLPTLLRSAPLARSQTSILPYCSAGLDVRVLAEIIK